MSSSVDQQKPEKVSSHNFDDDDDDFEHIPLSMFPETSMEQAKKLYNEEDRVLITYYKDKIEEDIVFQGYDVSNPPTTEFEMMIPKNKPESYQGKIKELTFFGDLSDDKKQEIIERYSTIAPIIFDSDERKR